MFNFFKKTAQTESVEIPRDLTRYETASARNAICNSFRMRGNSQWRVGNGSKEFENMNGKVMKVLVVNPEDNFFMFQDGDKVDNRTLANVLYEVENAIITLK